MTVTAAAAAAQTSLLDYAHEDPARIVSAEACGECHVHEFDVWEETPHATGFKTLHRKELAETIAGKLGFRLIKRQSFCYSCHYTAVLDDDQVKVVSGVSCESCHGAAEEWIEIHNSYGEGREAATETAEHRARRIEQSRAAGMRRPSDLYPVVANCFGCHTVPNERLVNVGGHTTGSAGFEFGEWSQGEIRHNFLDSMLAGGEPRNAERGRDRRRVMYVVGRALDLEYSLRGLAAATVDGIYSKAMSRRVRSALAEVRAIAGAAPVPELDEMIAAVKGARVVAGKSSELEALADRIGAATRAFLDGADGTRLAAIDPLVEGRPGDLVVDEPEEEVRVADAGSGGEGEAGEAPAGDAVTAASGGDEPRTRAAASPGVVGAIKRRIRPESPFRSVGPGSCSGCHEQQNEWWFGHAHSRSADPFFDGNAKNVQIALLYGVGASAMTRGDAVCMDCHGTVISGKERREVLDGVSCESCHGPAADWVEPHKEGKGRDRPAFAAALRQGKRDLRGLDARAAVCAGCHYITDPRLISSGHPSGLDFDYVGGMAEVRHWQSGPAPPAALTAAFRSELAGRGPVPDVVVASLPAVGPAPASGGKDESYEQVAQRLDRQLREQADSAAGPFAPRPLGISAPAAVEGPLDLPPFPEVDAEDTIEDILLLIQERLRLLHEQVHEQVGGGDR